MFDNFLFDKIGICLILLILSCAVLNGENKWSLKHTRMMNSNR